MATVTSGVSGHGVDSALLCISVLNVLRNHLLTSTDFKQPSAVLEGLNRAFQMDQNNDKYFTIWYGVYHLPSRKLTYASGGHHAVILIDHQNVASFLQTQGSVVGALPESSYASEELILPSSVELYLFSDGVYEIAKPDGSWQSWDDFVRFLQDNRPTVETIVSRMRDIRGCDEFEDDFSLLKITVL